MKILITGSSGFVGTALVTKLASSGRYTLRLSGRKAVLPTRCYAASNDEWATVDLSPDFDWRAAVLGCDVVIHLAARAHVLAETALDPLAEFRRINAHGSLNLARQAAAAGVQRFIFLSSIGVNGNVSTRPFTEHDTPKPEEPYAVSKLEAEIGLRAIALESEMDVVIIRPPLVYGPNAPGNFGRLANALVRGIPLPLGAIHNRRSLIGLENLADLIVTCMHHPDAANQTFLAADGEDISTTELLRRLGVALSRPARLWSLPQAMIELGAGLVGKRDIARRLCGSLQASIEKSRAVLGWQPPRTLDEGLRQVAVQEHCR